MKKLYRSEKNKVIIGIIAGVGEYFEVDPTILRLGWIILFFCTGVIPGLLAYIFAMAVVPKRPNDSSVESGNK